MDQLQEKIQEDQLQEVPPETPPEAPPEIAPEIVQEAMDTGWRPEEEFKGDKTKWRPADEWVKRGRDFIPFIKVQNKSLKNDISALKQTIESQKKTTEKLLKMSEKVGQDSYERAKRELTQKQMEAVKEGDVDAFAAIEKEKEDLKRPEPIVEEVQQPQDSPVFSAWKSSNDWYAKDPSLQLFADAYGSQYKGQNPNASYEDVLKAAELKVREEFPHKFTNQQRETPSLVDSGGVGGVQQSSNTNTYANLPADAKAQCNAWVKDGTMKSQEQYIKDYYEV